MSRFVILFLLLAGLVSAQEPADLTPEQRKELTDRAKVLNREGAKLYQEGRYPEAAKAFSQALEMRQKLYPPDKYPQGHPDLATSLSNRGFLLRAQEYTRAETFVRQALEMNQKLYPRGHSELATSLDNLGVLLNSQGEYARAEPFFRQALEMRQKIYPVDQYPEGHPILPYSLNNLGSVLLSQGESSKAETFFRQALEMNQKLYPQGHPILAHSLNNLGGLLQEQREYVKAEPYFREALEMNQKIHPQGHPHLALSFDNLGILLGWQREYARAEPFVRQALEMRQKLYPPEKYPQGHPELAHSLNTLGGLLNSQGEYARAETVFRQALEMRQKIYPPEKYPQGHPDLARGLDTLGVLLQLQGEYAKAEHFYRQALESQQQLVAREGELLAFAQALNFARTQDGTRHGYLSLTRSWSEAPDAYPHLWRVKGQFSRLLERRHRDLLASGNDRTRQLAGDLDSVRQRLARALLNPDADPKTQRERVDTLTRDKEKLEREIAERLQIENPRATGEALPTLDDLRKALPADAVLLDLIRYVDFQQDPKVPGAKGETRTPRYVAFVVTRDRAPVRVELGEAKAIDVAWEAWSHALNAGNATEADERKAARDFAQALHWDDVRKAIPPGIATLFVSPAGQLTQVPFAALPGAKPSTVLLEDFALATVPSPSFFLEQRNRKPKPSANTSALIVGGVDYAGVPDQLVSGETSRAPLKADKRIVWKPLPGSDRERELIADLATATGAAKPVVRTGTAASTEQVLRDLTAARYAVLATHGFFADPSFRSAFQTDPDAFRFNGGERATAGVRNPLVLSGLVFAGANRTGKDELPDRGIATGESIIGKRLVDLELAVLSACDTSLGDVAGGEGVLGLQRAFHVAGCPSVMASLWRVEDEATAVLMGLFYRNLWQEKQPPREALRNAQLAIYRNPGLVKKLTGKRGIDFTEVVIPPPPKEPTPAISAEHAPVRQWAAFTLSGVR